MDKQNMKSSKHEVRVDKPKNQKSQKSNKLSEGIYINYPFVRSVFSMMGSVVQIETTENALFEGIFHSFNSQFHIILQTVYEIDENEVTNIKHLEIMEYLAFDPRNIVTITAQNIELEHAHSIEPKRAHNESSFPTDSSISRCNGVSKSEKILEPWINDGEKDIQEIDLSNDENGNGWEAQEMFDKNEKEHGILSSYDDLIYTCPINKSDSAKYKEKDAKATKIANEMEQDRNSRVRTDNGESEEGKYSAVHRPNIDNDTNKYIPPPKRSSNKSGGGSTSKGNYASNGNSRPYNSNDNSSRAPSKNGSSTSRYTPQQPYNQLPECSGTNNRSNTEKCQSNVSITQTQFIQSNVPNTIVTTTTTTYDNNMNSITHMNSQSHQRGKSPSVNSAQTPNQNNQSQQTVNAYQNTRMNTHNNGQRKQQVVQGQAPSRKEKVNEFKTFSDNFNLPPDEMRQVNKGNDSTAKPINVVTANKLPSSVPVIANVPEHSVVPNPLILTTGKKEFSGGNTAKGYHGKSGPEINTTVVTTPSIHVPPPTTQITPLAVQMPQQQPLRGGVSSQQIRIPGMHIAACNVEVLTTHTTQSLINQRSVNFHQMPQSLMAQNTVAKSVKSTVPLATQTMVVSNLGQPQHLQHTMSSPHSKIPSSSNQPTSRGSSPPSAPIVTAAQVVSLSPTITQQRSPPIGQLKNEKQHLMTSSNTSLLTMADKTSAVSDISTTKVKDDESLETTSSLSTRPLNPDAKEFAPGKVYNYPVRSSITPNTSRPPTPSSYNLHASNAPPSIPSGMVLMQPIPSYVVPAPSYPQPPPPQPSLSRARKGGIISTHRSSEYPTHSTNIPVTAVTGQPIMTQQPLLASTHMGPPGTQYMPAFTHPSMNANYSPYQMLRMAPISQNGLVVQSPIGYHESPVANATVYMHQNGTVATPLLHHHHSSTPPAPPQGATPSSVQTSQSHTSTTYQHQSITAPNTPHTQIMYPLISAPPTHGPQHIVTTPTQQHQVHQYLQHASAVPLSLIPHNS